MQDVLLASSNAGKVREIRQIADGTPLRWHGLDEFPSIVGADETGKTFAENARAKALHFALATGLPTLADDSGLEVDALDGAPGIYSARFAGPLRDDKANNAKMVELLKDIPQEKRTARFRCAMAFVHDGEVALETDGRFEGQIIDIPRGTNGFGYDPHFLIPDLGKTAAELPPEQKNARSHRGRALRDMLRQIEMLYRKLGLWTA